MTKYQTYEVQGPWLGCFPDLQSREVPQQGFVEFNEFHILDGRIRKYLGWSQPDVTWRDFTLATLPEAPSEHLIFGYDFERFDGTLHFVVGSKVAIYDNPHNGIYTRLNDDDFTGADKDRWASAEMGDKLYLTNRVDPIQVFDGTTLAPLTNTATGLQVEAAHCVENVLNHLMFGNVKEGGTWFPQRIRWSDIDDANTWVGGIDNEAGYFDFPEDIGVIRGIKNLGPNTAIVYGSDAIYAMSYIGGDIKFAFEKRVSGEGLAAPYSLVVANDFHLFLGGRDFYVYDGGREPRPIGVNRVAAWFMSRWDKSIIENVYGFVHPNYPEIWWVFVDKDRPNDGFVKALCYNWQADAWSQRGLSTTFPFNFLARYLESNSNVRRIQDATNQIRNAVGTWRDKGQQNKGSWLILGGD